MANFLKRIRGSFVPWAYTAAPKEEVRLTVPPMTLMKPDAPLPPKLLK